MSDEKIQKLEDLHEKHVADINELKTNHRVHLAHHKSLDGKIDHIDGRVSDVESDQEKASGNMIWAVRIVIGAIILAVLSLVLKGNGGI